MNSPSASDLLRARILAPRRRPPQTRTRLCRAFAPIVLIFLAACAASGQGTPSDKPGDAGPSQQDQQPKSATPAPQTDSKSDSKQQPPAAAAPSGQSQQNSAAQNEQTNRILWVMPNYRAVSADTLLPPLSPQGKFVLATHDSLDYTSGLFAGFLAGWNFGTRAYPEFHSG